ncbi:NAD-dependent epimerase/dehydratase family protein [Myroides sp. 1354]|uniref:NAD-dependent epimerase/dehydratase family protein n=1 Tax=unclassified Myroides TaxID=2642485 RepID=UPI00257820F0|nr:MULTISPECIES: NAD-dependent epimerase/dehydratase family protein [unclassified Myroides]MDM1043981.1 NAD-dependent epimerase/dehydratase family protein [Myroides sp. R163-1]MDM1054916.1 NAD-dependent epimerase/dehydratase family protein [Myroides sp. 1354]MDM1068213.1 NAD-dependent epimerase/dehydratase family protein [Myroides sp. 1372]
MILVTGATGLVGSHLLLHLLQQEEGSVRAIYRNTQSINKTKQVFELYHALALFEQIQWQQADLLDLPALEKAFEGVTRVYHCAAMISFDPKDEHLMRKTNIEGTANIVNLCIAYQIAKLCHVSSIAALGESLHPSTPITEKTEWNPELYHSDYALSKFGGEMEVWRGTQEGLDVIIVNPGVIFGRGFYREGSSELLYKVHQGFPFYTSGTTAVVSVEDVVSCMIRLMRSNHKNERYILVSDNLDNRELLHFIAALLHKKPASFEIGRFGLALAWRLDAFISVLTRKKRSFTRAIAKASLSRFNYDTSKVEQTLSFQFISYRDFLTELSKSFK